MTRILMTGRKSSFEMWERFHDDDNDEREANSRKKNPLKEEVFEFAIPEREVDEQKYFFSNLKNTSNSSW